MKDKVTELCDLVIKAATSYKALRESLTKIALIADELLESK